MRIVAPLAQFSKFRGYLRGRRRFEAMAAIHEKYSAFTMIPRADYILNLQLAESVERIPGAVVECGVWRGGMIAGISEVLGSFRRYVLCDSFEGLPGAKPIDGPAALEWQLDTTSPQYHDNCSAPEAVARAAMAQSPAQNVQIMAGWFEATLPGVRVDEGIALLRLDGDWYESTITCLENLYHQVTPGGIVVVDDYYTWDGCARAVHDFLARRDPTARVRQWANTICYIRVPDAPRSPRDAGPQVELSRVEH